MKVSVQREDFDAGAEMRALSRDPKIGAVASFVGVVREVGMTLEHYPGMTEKSIEEIITQARGRWRVSRPSFWPTSRRRRSIGQAAAPSLSCWASWRTSAAAPLSSSRTMRASSSSATASCTSKTAASLRNQRRRKRSSSHPLWLRRPRPTRRLRIRKGRP